MLARKWNAPFLQLKEIHNFFTRHSLLLIEHRWFQFSRSTTRCLPFAGSLDSSENPPPGVFGRLDAVAYPTVGLFPWVAQRSFLAEVGKRTCPILCTPLASLVSCLCLSRQTPVFSHLSELSHFIQKKHISCPDSLAFSVDE